MSDPYPYPNDTTTDLNNSQNQNIQAAIDAAEQAAKLAATYYAYNQQAELRKKQLERLGQRESDLSSYFNKELNTPYTETYEAKSILSSLDKQYNKSLDQVAGSTAKSGSTDEAKIGARGEMLDNYSGLLSQLAAKGTDRKERMGFLYNNQMNNIYNQMDALNMNQQQSWTNLISNMQNASGDYYNARGLGAF